MSRLNALHNKTNDVREDDLPFNPTNVLLSEEELAAIFAAHGMRGIRFHNINLYRNAFVHRSYCTMKNADFTTGNERCPSGCLPLQEVSYERLEFLGDAILGMIVAKYLYERFPDQNEGFLSRMRTKIVNGKMLGDLSEKVGFPRFAILSKQVEETSGRKNFKIMEDIFEAFLGAIYMDFQTDADSVQVPRAVLGDAMEPLSGAGFFVAEAWVIGVMEKYLDFAELIAAKTNYKDMLVRHMNHSHQDAPRFFEVSVNTDKRTCQKVFTYCVKDKAGAVLGTATGASRKEAENNAALAALEFYGVAPTPA